MIETKDYLNRLREAINGVIKTDELMRYHTSLSIGGLADVFIVPRDVEDLQKILKICGEYRQPYYIIGNGTKILVPDKGIQGTVIKISNVLTETIVEGTYIVSGSGMSLSRLSYEAEKNGLSGLEFSVGIPGTVGGAVYMNAGAHGESVSNIITDVKVLDIEGNIKTISNSEMRFGYRTSILHKTKKIVVEALFNLKKGNSDEIKKKMEELLSWRRNTQPLEYPNAGSIFCNPPNDYAGRLIDEAGLKGLVVGGAQVSVKRANFIVNIGGARSSDVLKLMDIIQQTVYEKFSIKLEPEIQILE